MSAEKTQTENGSDTEPPADSGVSESVDALTQALTQALDQQSSQQSQQPQQQPGVGYHRLTEDLLITQDPDRYALTDRDGEHNGLTKYSDPPVTELAPDVDYISGELAGSVDTEDELYRGLASPRTSPILIGDAGTAKNTSIYAVASDLNVPVYRMQMGSGLTAFDLFSETDLRDGTTVTTLKTFGKAVVFGGIAVIDEINLADPGLIAHFNAMAEERGKRRVTLPGTGVTLSDLPEDKQWDADKHLGKYIHPDFRVVATRNPPSYNGTEKLNVALNDRFTPIRYEYPGVDVESRLLATNLGVDQDKIRPLVEVIQHDIRDARANNAGPSCPVSYRRLSDAIGFAKAHDATLFQAGMSKIAGYAQSEADRGFIRGALQDRKSELNMTLDGTVSDYECSHCGHTTKATDAGERERLGVCPDCSAPYMRDDKWETNYKSSYVARFRWVGSGDKSPAILTALWDSSNNVIKTYRYTGVNKNDFDALCNASSVGREVNNLQNRPRTESEKLATVTGIDKPDTIK